MNETINKERKKYEPITYNVWGEIEKVIEKRIYDKGGEYKPKDQVCYHLHLTNQRPAEVKSISAFKSKIENEKVWDDIVAGRFYGKKYIFYYQKYKQYFNLINWEEQK